MALLGSILKQAIGLRKAMTRMPQDGSRIQAKTLLRLLSHDEYTAFGEQYNFSKLLNEKELVKSFQAAVPMHDYNKIFRRWWYRALNGEPFICWPGKVKYFAL